MAHSTTGPRGHHEAPSTGHSLYTGPERTGDQIAADRKAANVFFSRFDTGTRNVVALARADENRRRYVHASALALMPPHRIHHSTPTERKQTVKRTANYWYLRQRPTPGIVRAALRDRQPYEQWLLFHPEYGPVRTETAPPRPPRRLRAYRKGGISPVGMTLDRALEIAIRALDNTDT